MPLTSSEEHALNQLPVRSAIARVLFALLIAVASALPTLRHGPAAQALGAASWITAPDQSSHRDLGVVAALLGEIESSEEEFDDGDDGVFAALVALVCASSALDSTRPAAELPASRLSCAHPATGPPLF